MPLSLERCGGRVPGASPWHERLLKNQGDDSRWWTVQTTSIVLQRVEARYVLKICAFDTMSAGNHCTYVRFESIHPYQLNPTRPGLMWFGQGLILALHVAPQWHVFAMHAKKSMFGTQNALISQDKLGLVSFHMKKRDGVHVKLNGTTATLELQGQKGLHQIKFWHVSWGDVSRRTTPNGNGFWQTLRSWT